MPDLPLLAWAPDGAPVFFCRRGGVVENYHGSDRFFAHKKAMPVLHAANKVTVGVCKGRVVAPLWCDCFSCISEPDWLTNLVICGYNRWGDSGQPSLIGLTSPGFCGLLPRGEFVLVAGVP